MRGLGEARVFNGMMVLVVVVEVMKKEKDGILKNGVKVEFGRRKG